MSKRKVKCIDSSGSAAILSIGEVYTVLSEDRDMLRLEVEGYTSTSWRRNRFIPYEEPKSAHIQSDFDPDLVEEKLNQVFKADAGKLQPNLLIEGCPRALQLIGAVLSYGAQKYAAHSWKNVDVERYKSAKVRHQLEAAKDDLSKDDESGLLHMAHEATNILFILEQLAAEMTVPEFEAALKFNPPPTAHKAPPTEVYPRDALDL